MSDVSGIINTGVNAAVTLRTTKVITDMLKPRKKGRKWPLD